MVTHCLPVVKEEIRAEVYFNSNLVAKTPYVKSFNVNKSRNQVSTTFNVTLELLGGISFPLGGLISIKAGTKGNLKSIFTGVVEGTQVRPVFGKPSYFSITMQGRAKLSELENKNFSRRLKSDGQGLFCIITGGPGNRTSTLKSLDKSIKAGNHDFISYSPSPNLTGENSPLVVFNNPTDGVGSSQAGSGVIGSIAGKPQGGGTGGSTGLGLHTHESLEEGGPAFAVYSAD